MTSSKGKGSSSRVREYAYSHHISYRFTCINVLGIDRLLAVPQPHQQEVDAQAPRAPLAMAAPEASSASDEEEDDDEQEQGPGYYGLDDSDLEEWLESSAATSAAGARLGAPRPDRLTLALTATVQRGAREGPGGDACRLVPPNRCRHACLAAPPTAAGTCSACVDLHPSASWPHTRPLWPRHAAQLFMLR